MSEAKHWFTAREGSSLAWYKPRGMLEGIIEVHPDHPPIMHWMDGRDEELKPDAHGKYHITSVDPFAPVRVGIGNRVEWSQLDDVENWTTIKGDEE